MAEAPPGGTHPRSAQQLGRIERPSRAAPLGRAEVITHADGDRWPHTGSSSPVCPSEQTVQDSTSSHAKATPRPLQGQSHATANAANACRSKVTPAQPYRLLLPRPRLTAPRPAAFKKWDGCGCLSLPHAHAHAIVSCCPVLCRVALCRIVSCRVVLSPICSFSLCACVCARLPLQNARSPAPLPRTCHHCPSWLRRPRHRANPTPPSHSQFEHQHPLHFVSRKWSNKPNLAPTRPSRPRLGSP
jgi:hypothetical protein